jgi:hypothetical protein
MTVEQRLTRLERQNRTLKLGLAGLIVAAGTALLMGQAAPPPATHPAVPDVVRARRFEVVNEAGVPVVTLMGWEHGGWIETRDNRGRRLFDVSATDDGAGLLSTYNQHGRDSVALGGVRDGSGLLMIYDSAGKKLIGLGASGHGRAVVVAYQGTDEPKAHWP